MSRSVENIRVKRDVSKMIKSRSRANIGSVPAKKIETPKKFKAPKYKLNVMLDDDEA